MCKNLSLGITRISWSFCCPGHGKGVWDGLGEVVKNTTAQYLIRHNLVLRTLKKRFSVRIHMLFASAEARECYMHRKVVKCKLWFIEWLNKQDTSVIRNLNKATKRLDNRYDQRPHEWIRCRDSQTILLRAFGCTESASNATRWVL